MSATKLSQVAGTFIVSGRSPKAKVMEKYDEEAFAGRAWFNRIVWFGGACFDC
jgi:hypothetical protein